MPVKHHISSFHAHSAQPPCSSSSRSPARLGACGAGAVGAAAPPVARTGRDRAASRHRARVTTGSPHWEIFYSGIINCFRTETCRCCCRLFRPGGDRRGPALAAPTPGCFVPRRDPGRGTRSAGPRSRNPSRGRTWGIPRGAGRGSPLRRPGKQSPGPGHPIVPAPAGQRPPPRGRKRRGRTQTMPPPTPHAGSPRPLLPIGQRGIWGPPPRSSAVLCRGARVDLGGSERARPPGARPGAPLVCECAGVCAGPGPWRS